MSAHTEFNVGPTDTTNDYADLGEAWEKESYGPAVLVVRNTGTANSATWKVLGSADGTTWVEVVAEAPLAHSTAAKANVNDYWPQLKVQVKSTVADTHTKMALAARAIET